MSKEIKHDSVAYISKLRPNWKIQKILGQGGEGIVYLVVSCDTACKNIVKIFHSPRAKAACKGLQAYSNCAAGKYPGLPKIDMIENEDQLFGVSYEYQPLYKVHYRLWGLQEQLAQAMVGSFCRMQAHLMSTCNITIWDGDVSNFLFTPNGQFHWVDFGWGITTVDHQWVFEHGAIGYGFATLLLSAHGINIKPLVLPTKAYSYAQPCRYCMDPRLDDLARKHIWLRGILAEIREQPAAALSEASIYHRISSCLPNQIQMPWVLIFASQSLRIGGHLWWLTKRMLQG